MKSDLPSELETDLAAALVADLPASALLFFLSYVGFSTSNADMATIGLCTGAMFLQLAMMRVWRFLSWLRHSRKV